MAEPETRITAVREWVAGLLLPLAIFVYTYYKDKADDQQRELDRVRTITSSLGSSDPQQRAMARSYIDYLAKHGQLPAGVAELVASNYATAPTQQESIAAKSTLETIAKADTGATSAGQGVVNALPVRLYLQIRKETDRTAAQQVEKLLASPTLTVPGIQLVASGPEISEVRYFHTEDQPTATDLARRLSNAGIRTVAKDSSRFARLLSSTVPQKQLELWLAPDVQLLQQ